MSNDIGFTFLTILPFIFFFSLLVGSLAYLLIRLRGTHSHVKQQTSIKHAVSITSGIVIVATAFCLALACILIFEAFNIRWN